VLLLWRMVDGRVGVLLLSSVPAFNAVLADVSPTLYSVETMYLPSFSMRMRPFLALLMLNGLLFP